MTLAQPYAGTTQKREAVIADRKKKTVRPELVEGLETQSVIWRPRSCIRGPNRPRSGL